MMIPRRVRKLRSGWLRIARRASARSSRGSMACPSRRSGRAARLVVLRLGEADGIVGLERPQGLERSGDERLAALEPGEYLDRELAGQAGLDRLEARLPVLHEIDALLLLRGGA